MEQDTGRPRVIVGTPQKLYYAVAKGRGPQNQQPSENLVDAGFDVVAPGLLSPAANDKALALVKKLMTAKLAKHNLPADGVKYRTIVQPNMAGTIVEVSSERDFAQVDLYNFVLDYLQNLSTADGNEAQAEQFTSDVSLQALDKVI